MVAAALSFAASLIVAVLVAWCTSVLTVRRDREADWRRLRLAAYQEYIVALSGIVVGREKPGAHERYADATNSMMLVAPAAVMNALGSYLAETSEQNESRSGEKHDRLLDALIGAMREDVSERLDKGMLNHPFRLRTVPTKYAR